MTSEPIRCALSRKDLDFGVREPGGSSVEEWNCVVAFRDAAYQDPFEMAFYVWQLGNLHDEHDPGWTVRMEACLKRALGYPVKVKILSNGNGHGHADLERVAGIT